MSMLLRCSLAAHKNVDHTEQTGLQWRSSMHEGAGSQRRGLLCACIIRCYRAAQGLSKSAIAASQSLLGWNGIHNAGELLNAERLSQPAIKAGGQALVTRVLKGVRSHGYDAHCRLRPILAYIPDNLHATLCSMREVVSRSEALLRGFHDPPSAYTADMRVLVMAADVWVEQRYRLAILHDLANAVSLHA